MNQRLGLAAAGLLAAAGAGLVACGVTSQVPAPPAPPPAAAPAASAVESSSSSPSPRRAQSRPVRGPVLPPAEPVSVHIPRLDVQSDTMHLGLQPDGAMEVPQSADPIGWYDKSPTPGVQGPAVLAGHVTWDRKPAVFFRLGEMRPGDRVEVERADGSTAVFSVTKIATYPKDDFPTVEVYRNLDHAGLRLITCAGQFDDESKRYPDNIVVYAEMVDTIPA